MPTTSYSNWDFYNFRVAQDLIGGQFVSAESTLVAAGPPRITGSDGTVGDPSELVYPIGLLESFGIQQNRQLQRIFEIGSTRSYFIPGRTVGSISLGRTFYFGPSLLRVLYAYYRDANWDMGTSEVGAKVTPEGVATEVPDPNAALLSSYAVGDLHELRRNPGYGYLIIDLASDLFAQPMGLAVYFKDANTNTVGGFYVEDAYVQGHQMSVSSGSVLVMEGVSIQYDRLVPLNVDAF